MRYNRAYFSKHGPAIESDEGCDSRPGEGFPQFVQMLLKILECQVGWKEPTTSAVKIHEIETGRTTPG